MSTAPNPPDVTPRLARFVGDCRWDAMPQNVRHEARRALVNFFACALAGWSDPAVKTAARVFTRLGGAGPCSLIGSGSACGLLQAASLNAMAGNVHDFDDTHLPTILHPTAPVAPALLALAQTRPVSGRALLEALVIGMELECRIALAVSPGHYARGWHITSTCGVFGSAAASAKVLGLAAEQVGWAIGSASAQAGGLVETLGTSAKSVSVGNAAANGLLSALLAQEGFGGPERPLEGERGFLPVYSTQVRWDALLDGLGERWEVLANAYKPYPCGVVLNPVLDACLALRPQVLPALDRIEAIELRGHPLLRQRTDRPGVDTGRLSQVSAQHAVAVALVRGRAGLAEFSDAAVQDHAVRALGARLRFVDDDAMVVDCAQVRLLARDGTEWRHRVDGARGGPLRPLTDAELEAKCREGIRHGGSAVDAEPLLEALWQLEASADAASLLRLAAPATP